MKTDDVKPDLERQVENLQAQLRFYKDREAYYAKLLKVADGGQYRADWDGAIDRLVRERDEAVAGLLDPLKALPTHRVYEEASRRKRCWGDKTCCSCGGKDPGAPCGFTEHAKFTCGHANKRRNGRDPEGDVQWYCPNCERIWWTP